MPGARADVRSTLSRGIEWALAPMVRAGLPGNTLGDDREEAYSALGTIVCAVDSSAGAAEAVRAASRLSQDLGLRLVLAHVASGHRLEDGPAGVSGRLAQEGAERLLAQVVRVHGLNGKAERRAEVGTPVDLILRVAAEEAADMIVVGASRRRGKLKSALAGELAGAASCPVVVVPPAP
jgi:nucleotide-binding universal stress UspA family protein